MQFDIMQVIEMFGIPLAILIYVFRDMRRDMRELTGVVNKLAGIIIACHGGTEAYLGD